MMDLFSFLLSVIVVQFFSQLATSLLHFPERLKGGVNFRSFPPPCEEKTQSNLINQIKSEHQFSSSNLSPETDSMKCPLPWRTSVLDSRKLSYMSMLDIQLHMMKSLGMEECSIDESLICRHSTVKTARIGNMQFRNNIFRKVRLTYFDAGDAVQVFNTLWYPSFEYDLPLFGVDLISLGKNRVLSVIDFQPLHPTEEYHSKYIQHLSATRMQYPELHGTLSGKIYDDTSFFSKNMLFGRFKDESLVNSVVFPAFKDYLEQYIALAAKSTPDYSPASMAAVEKRQQEYDVYSALKDPAVGLFEAYFGKEWTDSFVHDFLFSLCRDSSAPLVPVHQYKIDQQSGTVQPIMNHHSVKHS